MRRGMPFSIETFYSLGSVTAVQKTMSRLAKEGRVVRVAKGIYSRPKPLASFPAINITAKAEDVAKIWAKTKRYKMVPQGLEAAYRLGMQTQAPIKSVYWTDGPTREFCVGNERVFLKHTVESKLLWANKPEGVFYRGLLSLSPEFTGLSSLNNAIKRLNINKEEARVILQKLSNNPMLRAWQPKLIQLLQSLHS